jgi:4-hydroxybenzoate polyprenyltransferase
LLTRPANIVTSVADVLAGVAISGIFLAHTVSAADLWRVWLLCLATIGLYGGGVVFNDVFDAKLDAVERPERPIPRGIVTVAEASILGGILLSAGIVFAFFCNFYSGLTAMLIAAAALVYDKWGKHHPWLGPMNMGLCRGLNLLLGVSVYTGALMNTCWMAVVPILYIASITMISRGEVHGGSKNILYAAVLFYLLVIGAVIYIAVLNGNVLWTLVFLAAFAWMIFKPLFVAIGNPEAKNIGKAVKAGVIGLILMDASWAAASEAWYLGILILLLLPLSMYLGRIFAVT